jgi:hypothetical protein
MVAYENSRLEAFLYRAAMMQRITITGDKPFGPSNMRA